LKNKSTIWIGVLSVALFLGAGSASAAPTTKKKTSKAAPGPKLYSAERSLTRQAKLARARAALMAHEMAVTPLPRMSTRGGDLVPDVRAAAAIIYNPDTNQVL
jgi:hypothetical protein